MSLLSLFLGEKKTANVARERLQIILAHERSGRHTTTPDYLPALQRELLAVISKYVAIDLTDISVNFERQDNLEACYSCPERTDQRLQPVLAAPAGRRPAALSGGATRAQRCPLTPRGALVLARRPYAGHRADCGAQRHRALARAGGGRHPW